MLNLFKKKSNLQEEIKVMSSVDHCIKLGTIKVNVNTYEAWINTDIHWNTESKKWRQRFISNLKTYIDMRRVINKAEPIEKEVTVFDIDTKLQLKP